MVPSNPQGPGYGPGSGSSSEQPRHEWSLRAAAERAEKAAVCLAKVQPKPLEWLWPGYLPRGVLVLLDGDPGLGKSFLTLDLAARLSVGRQMPPGGATGALPPQQVLLLNAEDDLERTIQPRLVALGADLAKCHALTEVDDGPDVGKRPLSLPEDLGVVEVHIRKRRAALVVIDPLMAYLTGRVDSYRDSDVRKVLYRLKCLAEQTQATLLLVRHLNKNSAASDPLYRGGGSIGIIGAARIAWLVGRHPEEPSQRVLCRLKGNLGAQPTALAYTIEADGPSALLRWLGPVPFGPSDLLSKPAAPVGRPPEPPHAAMELLLRELANGPRPAPEIEIMAELQGIPKGALRRAKEALGILAIHPRSPRGQWTWRLPDTPPSQSRLADNSPVQGNYLQDDIPMPPTQPSLPFPMPEPRFPGQ